MHQEQQKAYIGEEKAKAIAFGHAGITESEVSNFKIDFDLDKGVMVYELEFKTNEYKYDYEINAKTGDIVENDREALSSKGGAGVAIDNNSGNTGDNITDSNLNNTNNGISADNASYIGEEKAKAIAYEKAGVKEADVTNITIHLDDEDGVIVYEIEFKTAEHKYDYTIDALTGEAIDIETESKTAR